MTVSDFEQAVSKEIFENVLLKWDMYKKIDESCITFLRGYMEGLEKALKIYKEDNKK